MDNGMKVVSVSNIKKTYKDVQALNGISFDVEKGEIFGIIGPDGAGKTSLFRILTTLLLADSGTAVVDGNDVVKEYKQIRQKVGYMPGRFSLYQDLTVEENLKIFATLFGTTIEENYHLVEAIYSQIEPFKKRKAGALSGGMKQKLALSCALIHEPVVLFLDEPTTGVDPVSRKELWDVLKDLKQHGVTILVSTPYMDEAELCDRVALLQKGRVLEITDPSIAPESDGVELFSLRSSRGAYAYLERIRSMEECKYAWLFGDELHVSPKSPADAERMNILMKQWDDPTLQWQVIIPSIEDRFMGLIEQNSGEQSTNGETI